MSASRGDRALIATLGAHERWLRCTDRTAATEAARQAFQDRFITQVDPDGSLRDRIATIGPTTARGKVLVLALQQRVEHARKAYYTRLALASVKARRAQRERRAS